MTAKILELGKFKFLSLIAFIFWPGLLAILHGQTSVIFLIIFLFILKFSDSKPFLAGLISSFFLSKIQFLLFVPYAFILSKRKKDFLWGFFPGITVLLLVTLLSAGLGSIIQYPGFIFTTRSTELGSPQGGLLNLAAFLISLGWADGTVLIVNAILYFASLYLFSIKLEKLNDRKNAFYSGLVFTAIFSYHIGQYDLLILVLPVISLIYSFITRQSWPSLLSAGILMVVPFFQYTKMFVISVPLLAYVAFRLLATKKQSSIKSGSYRNKSTNNHAQSKLVFNTTTK